MARIAAPIVCAVSVFFIFAFHESQAQYAPSRVFVVHGVGETCAAIGALDHALAGADPSYFAGWTNADYNAATQWAAACVTPGYEFVGSGRAARLRAYQAKVMQVPAPSPQPQAPPSQEQIAAEAAAREKLAQDQAEWARKEAEEGKREAAESAARARVKAAEESQRRARADAVAACRHSDAHRIFQAQQRLRDDIDTKDRIDEAVEHEKKIEERSGVQNLALNYRLGAQSGDIDEQLEKDWKDYHLAGGRSTPDTGLQVVDNPCTGTTADPVE
jgi:hypothetical protein